MDVEMGTLLGGDSDVFKRIIRRITGYLKFANQEVFDWSAMSCHTSSLLKRQKSETQFLDLKKKKKMCPYSIEYSFESEY